MSSIRMSANPISISGPSDRTCPIMEASTRACIGGDVVKLFKKTLSVNGSSLCLTIEKKNEGSFVIRCVEEV